MEGGSRFIPVSTNLKLTVQLASEENHTYNVSLFILLSFSFGPKGNYYHYFFCATTHVPTYVHAHTRTKTHTRTPLSLFFPTSLLIKLGKYRSSCELRLRCVRGQEVRSSPDSQHVHATSTTQWISLIVMFGFAYAFWGLGCRQPVSWSVCFFFYSDNTLEEYGKRILDIEHLLYLSVKGRNELSCMSNCMCDSSNLSFWWFRDFNFPFGRNKATSFNLLLQHFDKSERDVVKVVFSARSAGPIDNVFHFHHSHIVEMSYFLLGFDLSACHSFLIFAQVGNNSGTLPVCPSCVGSCISGSELESQAVCSGSVPDSAHSLAPPARQTETELVCVCSQLCWLSH